MVHISDKRRRNEHKTAGVRQLVQKSHKPHFHSSQSFCGWNSCWSILPLHSTIVQITSDNPWFSDFGTIFNAFSSLHQIGKWRASMAYEPVIVSRRFSAHEDGEVFFLSRAGCIWEAVWCHLCAKLFETLPWLLPHMLQLLPIGSNFGLNLYWSINR